MAKAKYKAIILYFSRFFNRFLTYNKNRNAICILVKRRERDSPLASHRPRAEREGFVLEFCKTSRLIYMLCFAKFFGHRSKTVHRTVLSLRSNPIIFSDKTKKAPTRVLFRFGGERGIRTLGTVLAFTRFPIVRLRPAQPSLHLLDFYIISQKYKKSSPFLKFFLVFFIFFKKILKNIKKFFKKLLTIEFHCAIISTFRKNVNAGVAQWQSS